MRLLLLLLLLHCCRDAAVDQVAVAVAAILGQTWLANLRPVQGIRRLRSEPLLLSDGG